MKRNFVRMVMAAATFVPLATSAQTARVMAVHNSPDAAVDTVDVWLVDGNSSVKIKDNLAFRQSTGFIDAPAGRNIRLAFAGKNSTMITDTLLGFGYNLTPNETYILFAQGHVATGFNPQQPFGLNVLVPARERYITAGDTTSIAIYHGSTDAPAVDIYARGVQTPLVGNAAYGAITSYLNVKTTDLIIDVKAAGSSARLVSYQAPLSTLGLQDSALVVFASGFLNPAQNKNGAAFGLFAALSNGSVVPLPLQSPARVQVIHNSADPAASSVDIWLINKTQATSSKIIDNFAFRTATGYVELPSGDELAVAVAGASSTSITDTLLSQSLGVLPSGGRFVAMANGVVLVNNFESNPGGKSINFRLTLLNGREAASTANKVDIAVVHGATDAPAVDIAVSGGPVLVPNVQFGEATANYLAADPNNIRLEVRPAGSSSVVAAYAAPLSVFKDSAIVAFASGFLSPNIPVGKDAGAAFGLFVATASGNVIPLSNVTSVRESKSFAAEITLYPNPASKYTSVNLVTEQNTSAIINITDLSGKVLRTPYSGELSSGNNRIDLDLNGLKSGIYLVRISGVTGNTFRKLIVQ
ncbi:MAG: DUF4397 domain-containing protein [Bacteroidia bacterium]